MSQESADHTTTAHIIFDPFEGGQSVNVAQHFIVTTEDKLRLVLHRLKTALEGTGDAVAPFTTLLTLILALATSDFKAQFFYVVFLLAAGGSGVWLLVAISRIRGRPKYTVDDAIRDIATPPPNVRPFTAPDRGSREQ